MARTRRKRRIWQIEASAQQFWATVYAGDDDLPHRNTESGSSQNERHQHVARCTAFCRADGFRNAIFASRKQGGSQIFRNEQHEMACHTRCVTRRCAMTDHCENKTDEQHHGKNAKRMCLNIRLTSGRA